MKTRLLLLPIALFVQLSMYAQTRTDPYEFPVRPGTEAWKSLRSAKDAYKATQIPPDILSNLTTAALVRTCLNYPNLLLMYGFSDLQQGFNELKNNFNGFAELVNRKDAGPELLKVYAQMDPAIPGNATSAAKGDQAIRFKYIETIISQYDILGNMDATARKLLVKESLKKYDSKKTNAEVYGISGLEPTTLILARILDKQEKLLKDAGNNHFLKSGIGSTQAQLEDIYNKAKAFVQ